METQVIAEIAEIPVVAEIVETQVIAEIAEIPVVAEIVETQVIAEIAEIPVVAEIVETQVIAEIAETDEEVNHNEMQVNLETTITVTTAWNTGPDGSPVETIVDQYFENNGTFDTGGGNFVPIRVVAVHSRVPITPIPASCPVGYSLLGYNSNIWDSTTVSLPYTENSNNMTLTNELHSVGSSDYYFKIFNVNGVKIGGVIYKIWNPDFDFHWAFTICLED